MSIIRELYDYMEEQGFDPYGFETKEEFLTERINYIFKVGNFIFIYEDDILLVQTCYCQYFGKPSPEINEDEFNQLTSMMASYHKIGRFTFNTQPLYIRLDWSMYLIDEHDFSRAKILYVQLEDVREKWAQIIFDVIYNDASFEELYMEMKE
tara:strand:- start:894 stop:1349 length:456 start_codon:yes stop_codon:yes gene_type:complete